MDAFEKGAGDFQDVYFYFYFVLKQVISIVSSDFGFIFMFISNKLFSVFFVEMCQNNCLEMEVEAVFMI
ncbi:hypothetical protein X787_01900 [Listeria monocytogenes]|nr:hypothetical protein [Listeria monocytogenes]EIO9131711.1 hypothetical protein [Listeria monocytogenes]